MGYNNNSVYSQRVLFSQVANGHCILIWKLAIKNRVDIVEWSGVDIVQVE